MIPIQKYMKYLLLNLNYNPILLVDLDQNKKSNHFAMVDYGKSSAKVENTPNVKHLYNITLIICNPIIQVDHKVKALVLIMKALVGNGADITIKPTMVIAEHYILSSRYNTLGQNGGMRNEQQRDF